MIRITEKMAMVRVFLIGAAVGAGAGAILGLLVAPKRGAELRHDVKSGIGKFLGGAQQLADGAFTHASVMLQDARQVERDENTMLPFAGSIL
jgi:gas vesicle protein